MSKGNGPEAPVLSGCLRYLEISGLGGMALVTRGWRELDAALRREGYAIDGMKFFNGSGM
jgi:hypothetical protein